MTISMTATQARVSQNCKHLRQVRALPSRTGHQTTLDAQVILFATRGPELRTALYFILIDGVKAYLNAPYDKGPTQSFR